MKQIFLDYASTTPVDSAVVEAMLPFFTTTFGNPSSIHRYGRDARKGVENARQHVANLIHAKPEEIIFTAGGTESDNIAIKGIAYQNKEKRKAKGPHIITCAIEHPAVLETCRHLQTQGFDVAYLPVDQYGMINLDELEETISENTFLISVMFANNEIGTIQPIAEIGKIARDHDVVFHTDAVQAVGKVPVDVHKQNIDLLALSAHKMYGPKGIGALYVKKGVKPVPLIHGGGHEGGLRSSTLNSPGIIGVGKACELAAQRMEKDTKRIQKLRDMLIKNALTIEESYLNGHPTQRLPNNVHLRFTGVEGESLLLALDEKGIATSTSSACASRKLQTSHVLLALGLDPVEAHGSLRLSLGRFNTDDEIQFVSQTLIEVVNKLRLMSPLWNR